MKLKFISGGVLAALVGLGWAGLRVQPAPFATAAPQQPGIPKTIPLPAGLPMPVERFYRQLYGESVPVITSAIISGRGSMRPVGSLSFLARLRFTHRAGQSYRHYFETTVFGLPVMKVNEYFVDGQGRMELPWGVQAGEQIDQAANLSLWGEMAAWLPAALLTDPRVRWEAVDDSTALLVVPFDQAEERFVARFDPATGRLWLLESMRYKGGSQAKTLWFNELREWGRVSGHTLPTVCTVTWGDDGRPWLALTIEEVVYNVEVDTSLAAKGP